MNTEDSNNQLVTPYWKFCNTSGVWVCIATKMQALEELAAASASSQRAPTSAWWGHVVVCWWLEGSKPRKVRQAATWVPFEYCTPLRRSVSSGQAAVIGVLGLARSPLAPTRLVSLEDLVRAAVAAAYPRTRPPRPDCPGESPVRTLESPLSDVEKKHKFDRAKNDAATDACQKTQNHREARELEKTWERQGLTCSWRFHCTLTERVQTWESQVWQAFRLESLEAIILRARNPRSKIQDFQ